MITTMAQAQAAVTVALRDARPGPDFGWYDEYPDWERWRAFIAAEAVYGLISDRSLRERWLALWPDLTQGPDLEFPCQGCGSPCELHQPGCPVVDPAYLAWQAYQERRCHASVTYGPREDPYGATCEKAGGHTRSPDPDQRGHAGPDALGGGWAVWDSGGGTIAGDPVPVKGLHLVLPAELEPCLICGDPVPPGMLLCPPCDDVAGNGHNAPGGR